jgi:hypothetical protein
MAQGTSTTTSIPFANTLTRRYDGASSVTQYAGYAYSGASESDSVWSITRLTISDSGSVATATASNVAWSNRVSVIYS